MAKRSLVWVWWKDACHNSQGWTSADDIDTGKRFHCETAGMFVKEDKNGLVLATDYDSETEQWRSFTFIPKAMIKKKKVIKIDG
jgi:hypothetical protein